MSSDEAGLFDSPALPAGSSRPGPPSAAPLAIRMRPRTPDEVVGQAHLLRAGAPLKRLIDGESTTSVMLYGPPGTGKTTIARLLASVSSRHFVALSALTSGVKELREVIVCADRRRREYQTLLFIDEVHRFSKTQQDALLGAVEDRLVVLVGATTENPSFSVVAPLLSRMLVLKLRPITDNDLREVLRRAVSDDRGLGGRVALTSESEDLVVRLAGGDARSALTILEASAAAVLDSADSVVDVSAVERTIDEVAVRYDRDGDQHHDVLSAFIKSIRGSDPDAALHYLARMLVAGEDPRTVARRLIVHASEDIGLADPSALQTAVAAAHTVQMIGMPEARLALAQATIHLATAPKSNTIIVGIDEAMSDVRAGVGGNSVPAHLRFSRYSGAKEFNDAVGYRYPQRSSDGILEQQYPPDTLVGRDYYRPTQRGEELTLYQRLASIRRVVRGK